jgi:hypothetical protein
MIKKSGKFKSKADRSLGFKSVTFNVEKTLNDSHSVLIQLNSPHFFPGDTVSGYVYLNFSENLPSESIDLIVAGYEETNFTLTIQPDIKEQQGLHKHFAKKVYLLKSEQDYIKAGEYVFPFQFALPHDIPASVTYQDNYCNALIKYEISLSMVSNNKETMDDLLAKKMIYVYEKKKINDYSKTFMEKRADTYSESNIEKMSGKEKFLDFYKTFNEEMEDSSKTEYYEFPIVFKPFCCFKEQSLLMSFIFPKSNILINETFQIVNKLQGDISLDFINYALYREIKCESAANKFYNNKTLIEEQEFNKFQNKEEMSIKVNFLFKGTLDLRVSRMPSCHGILINCNYYILVMVKLKGLCARIETYKIPIHVAGEVNTITSQKMIAEVENVCLDDELKNFSQPLQIIVLK